MFWEKDFINQIICGDCIEILNQIPDNSIDLVVTSPPYNLGINYDNYNDRIPWENYYNWCRKWMREIYRVLKPDGRFCLNHYFSLGVGEQKKEKIKKMKSRLPGYNISKEECRQSPLMDLNWIATKEIGFKHHAVVFWTDITISKKTAFGSWLSASAPYICSPFEGILILYKQFWKKQTKGKTEIEKELFVKLVRGVWDLGTVPKPLTPAAFPKKLPEYCIRLLSYEGDIVLDPFSGSGTTCLVAKRLNRRYIGIEISPRYCEIARDRILKFENNKAFI